MCEWSLVQFFWVWTVDWNWRETQLCAGDKITLDSLLFCTRMLSLLLELTKIKHTMYAMLYGDIFVQQGDFWTVMGNSCSGNQPKGLILNFEGISSLLLCVFGNTFSVLFFMEYFPPVGIHLVVDVRWLVLWHLHHSIEFKDGLERYGKGHCIHRSGNINVTT